MRQARIAPIVEGHGEIQAVPLLLRRMGRERPHPVVVDVPHPIRVLKNKLQRPEELERAVDLAARKAGQAGAVLVLLDADDDRPCEIAPRLLQRAQAVRSDVPIAVVLANREFESWFLAAWESIREHRRVVSRAAPPEDPESVRGAKEWIEAHMDENYSEVLHQPAFVDLMDLEQARKAPSFDKFFRDVVRLIEMVAVELPEGSRSRR